MKKQILFLFFISVSFKTFTQSTKNTLKIIQEFEKTFKEKDFDGITSLFTKDFSIGIYQRPMLDGMLKQMLNIYFIDSIRVEKEIRVKNGLKVRVKIYPKDKKEFLSTIFLSKKGKIKYVDLFDVLSGFVNYRYKKSKKITSFPFEINQRGSIIVNVKLNDSKQTFKMLFDTGSSGMALSESTAKKANVKNIVTNHKVSVVGASMQVKLSSGNTIHLAGISIANKNTAIFPKMEYDGILGTHLFSNYITNVNFDTKTITLYSFGTFKPKNKKSVALPLINSGVNVIIPHIAEKILLNNGKQLEGNYVFDTGAGYNIILFNPVVQKNQLSKGFKADAFSTNYNFGQITPTIIGNFPKITLGNHIFYNVMGVLQTGTKNNTPLKLKGDGSIGISLISKFNFTIDLFHQVIYLEPNKTINNPFDFILSGIFIHYTKDRKMIIKNIIPNTKASYSKINGKSIKGGIINDIDGYTADDLIKNPKNIILLRKKNQHVFHITKDQNSTEYIF